MLAKSTQISQMLTLHAALHQFIGYVDSRQTTADNSKQLPRQKALFSRCLSTETWAWLQVRQPIPTPYWRAMVDNRNKAKHRPSPSLAKLYTQINILKNTGPAHRTLNLVLLFESPVASATNRAHEPPPHKHPWAAAEFC